MESREYTITVQGGASFPCKADEFVLSAMLRARDGPIKHGCCGGGCGVCKMRIVSGEYEKAKRMSRAHVTDREEREGIVLLCCIKPLGNLVVAGITETNQL